MVGPGACRYGSVQVAMDTNLDKIMDDQSQCFVTGVSEREGNELSYRKWYFCLM